MPKTIRKADSLLFHFYTATSIPSEISFSLSASYPNYSFGASAGITDLHDLVGTLISVLVCPPNIKCKNICKGAWPWSGYSINAVYLSLILCSLSF